MSLFLILKSWGRWKKNGQVLIIVEQVLKRSWVMGMWEFIILFSQFLCMFEKLYNKDFNIIFLNFWWGVEIIYIFYIYIWKGRDCFIYTYRERGRESKRAILPNSLIVSNNLSIVLGILDSLIVCECEYVEKISPFPMLGLAGLAKTSNIILSKSINAGHACHVLIFKKTTKFHYWEWCFSFFFFFCFLFTIARPSLCCQRWSVVVPS